MNKIILCFITLLIAASVQAELLDPQDILIKVDRFVGNKSFEEAFHLSDYSTYSHVSEPTEGAPYTLQISKRVMEVQHDKVVVMQSYPGEYQIPRSSYEAVKGNSLRALLQNWAKSGKVTVRSIKSTKFLLGVERLSAIQVFVTDETGSFPESRHYFTMIKKPYLAQIGFHESYYGGGDKYTIRLTSFIRPFSP